MFSYDPSILFILLDLFFFFYVRFGQFALSRFGLNSFSWKDKLCFYSSTYYFLSFFNLLNNSRNSCLHCKIYNKIFYITLSAHKRNRSNLELCRSILIFQFFFFFIWFDFFFLPVFHMDNI